VFIDALNVPAVAQKSVHSAGIERKAREEATCPVCKSMYVKCRALLILWNFCPALNCGMGTYVNTMRKWKFAPVL
jgi:ribosomal protein L37AE/L43A